MNFRPNSTDDHLEINLVPLIDVLLVILIFLAATTTFTRVTQLEVNLPKTTGESPQPDMISLAISQDGIYAMDGQLLSGNTTEDIAQALRVATEQHDNPALLINADEQARHQAVIRVMQAAKTAGITNINFATQASP